MISVNEAIEQITNVANLLKPTLVPLQKAGDHVLAEDVFAGINIPSFNQSAMDGYAFRFADLLHSNEFLIASEVAAGDSANHQIQVQQAARIFTGAAIPPGLDTVVMQEKTLVHQNRIIIKDDALVQGRNVRLVGSEIKKGELALAKDTVLTPAAIGFLASLGLTEILVYPHPAVHIIVTGKELQQPGKPLSPGQVYESNGVMLQAALDQLQITTSVVTCANDTIDNIAAKIRTALKSADLILLTGGVSVGNYDFVVQAAAECGVEKLFHKVAQRPGKPLFCGVKEDKIVFGLPGNPASVLSCFYQYVVSAIERLTGRKEMIKRRQLALLEGINKTNPLRQFLKGHYTTEGVLPLGAQESFRLSSFSVANCLIDLPEGNRAYTEGDTVAVLLIA